MMIAMLRPILTNFIAQMKEHDVEGLIRVFKAIIIYLEKDEEELMRIWNNGKKEGKTVNEEDKKVIPFSR